MMKINLNWKTELHKWWRSSWRTGWGSSPESIYTYEEHHEYFIGEDKTKKKERTQNIVVHLPGVIESAKQFHKWENIAENRSAHKYCILKLFAHDILLKEM